MCLTAEDRSDKLVDSSTEPVQLKHRLEIKECEVDKEG